MAYLNALFTLFDELIDQYGVGGGGEVLGEAARATAVLWLDGLHGTITPDEYAGIRCGELVSRMHGRLPG